MLRYSGMRFSLIDCEGVSRNVMQVTKGKAKKAYENGEPVWMHPCNMAVRNPWQNPIPISKKRIEDNAFFNGSTFEDIVNDFHYYNCDNERGKYLIFFVPAA